MAPLAARHNTTGYLTESHICSRTPAATPGLLLLGTRGGGATEAICNPTMFLQGGKHTPLQFSLTGSERAKRAPTPSLHTHMHITHPQLLSQTKHINVMQSLSQHSTQHCSQVDKSYTVSAAARAVSHRFCSPVGPVSYLCTQARKHASTQGKAAMFVHLAANQANSGLFFCC